VGKIQPVVICPLVPETATALKMQPVAILEQLLSQTESKTKTVLKIQPVVILTPL
jgi:hypothetical protein